jgi:hypothetical protein
MQQITAISPNLVGRTKAPLGTKKIRGTTIESHSSAKT